MCGFSLCYRLKFAPRTLSWPLPAQTTSIIRFMFSMISMRQARCKSAPVTARRFHKFIVEPIFLPLLTRQTRPTDSLTTARAENKIRHRVCFHDFQHIKFSSRTLSWPHAVPTSSIIKLMFSMISMRQARCKGALVTARRGDNNHH